MSGAFLRWTAVLGLLAVLSADTALGQDEIKFDSSAGASKTDAAASVSDSPSNSPFVPEDQTGVAGGARLQMAPPDVTQPMPGRVRGILSPEPLLGGNGCGADCEDCPRVGLAIFGGVESYKNLSNSLNSLVSPFGSIALQSNTGVVTGANLGVPIPKLDDFGLGLQVGASYGLYNMDGRTSFRDGQSESASQRQIFITTGFFRRAFEGAPFSAGLVYDWQINDNFGALGLHPFLGQWRAQVGYCLNASNEIGVWGTYRDRFDYQEIDVQGLFPVFTRPVSQVNLFWHHNFQSGADSWLWFGVPENEDLRGIGRLGEYTMGATFNVPITEHMAVYATGQYMRPTASPGADAAQDNAYTIGFGLVFTPRINARTRSVAGNCWMPYMPVANNSNFLIDNF